MKKLRFVFVLLAAVLALTAFGADWATFKSKDGKFSVSMPGAPKADSQPLNDSSKSEIHLFTLDLNTSAYIVSYNDYTMEGFDKLDKQALLDGARDGMGSGMKATLVKESKRTQDGAPGRMLLFKMDDAHMARAVIYLSGNRLYQALAIVPKEDENGEDITRFLESFAFTK